MLPCGNEFMRVMMFFGRKRYAQMFVPSAAHAISKPCASMRRLALLSLPITSFAASGTLSEARGRCPEQRPRYYSKMNVRSV